MSISNTPVERNGLKQRLFIGALLVLSIIVAAIVLFCFSPGNDLGEATPSLQVSHPTFVRSVRA
jgi:hypothetical protein